MITRQEAQTLREGIRDLLEYMQSASAFRGPEPGNMWSLGVAYNGSPQAQLFRDKEEDSLSEKDKAEKRRKPDFRATLRRISIGLQRWQHRQEQ